MKASNKLHHRSLCHQCVNRLQEWGSLGKFEEVWGRMGKYGESLHPDVLLLYSDFFKAFFNLLSIFDAKTEYRGL